MRKILDALMKEASVNIVQAKQDIVAFVESPWDHAKVEPIPRLLEEISGALRMLGLVEPAALMSGIVRFVEVELLRHRRVPTVEQMDKLADALASIEYYMEATREQRGGRDQILQVTRSSLESLGYWPVPQDDGGAAGSAAPQAQPASVPEPATFAAHPMAAEVRRHRRKAAPAADFPEWSKHLPTDVEAGLSLLGPKRSRRSNTMHRTARRMKRSFPASELPADEGIDAFIARFERSEEPRTGDHPAPPATLPEVDLRYAVDIAPGHGVEDLVVGDAPPPQPAAHDLHGLALTETEVTAPPAASAETLMHTAAPGLRYIEVEEEIEEEVPDSDVPASMADTSFHTSASDEIDAEIREVFVDEVQEEFENLSRNLPLWQQDPNDFERLKPIRRSFHTLKGSGRLVGALALGDFSWKVENMLNRVLDKTIPPSTAVQTLAAQAIAALPELLAGLRGEGAPKSDIGAIMNVADRLAAGEEAGQDGGTDAHEKSAPYRAPPSCRWSTRSCRRRSRLPAPAAPADEPAPAANRHHSRKCRRRRSRLKRPLPRAQRPAVRCRISIRFCTISSAKSPRIWRDRRLRRRAQAAYQPLPASEPLLRAVHTLNGAVAMVDVPVITQVLAPLENYIKRLCAGHLAPTPDGLMVLSEASELIRRVLARWTAKRTCRTRTTSRSA